MDCRLTGFWLTVKVGASYGRDTKRERQVTGGSILHPKHLLFGNWQPGTRQGSSMRRPD